MDNNILQIRIISFKDSTKHNLDNILCYIKKLTQLPSNNGKTQQKKRFLILKKKIVYLKYI